MKLTALFRLISLALCLVLLPFTASLGGEDTLQVSEYSSIARLRQAGLRKAREAEEEGIVLLRNEGNTLPLGTGARVALFGVTSVDPVYGGTGSGQVQTSSAQDFAEQEKIVVAKIDNVIGGIDGQIKDFETREKQEKYDAMKKNGELND